MMRKLFLFSAFFFLLLLCAAPPVWGEEANEAEICAQESILTIAAGSVTEDKGAKSRKTVKNSEKVPETTQYTTKKDTRKKSSGKQGSKKGNAKKDKKNPGDVKPYSKEKSSVSKKSSSDKKNAEKNRAAGGKKNFGKTESAGKGKEALESKGAREWRKQAEGVGPDLVISTDTPPELEAWTGKNDQCAISLFLWRNHFFVLRCSGGKRDRDVTGFWRESHDGVNLGLYNAQDLEITLNRGKNQVYASLGSLGWGYADLLPAKAPAEISFHSDGILRSRDKTFVDAPSGKSFPVDEKALHGLKGKEPLFANVEIAGGKVRRVERHSRRIPRSVQSPEKDEGVSGHSWKVFRENVLGRYWLLPRMPKVEKAVISFMGKDSEGDAGEGLVEISGPGLHSEGSFSVVGGRLGITLNGESRKDLEALGLDALARQIEGEFEWNFQRGSLRLAGENGNLDLTGS